MSHIGTAERLNTFTLLRVWPAVLAVLLLVWIAVVAGRGALLALQTAQTIRAFASHNSLPSDANSLRSSLPLVIYFSSLLVALAARRLWPTTTLPVTAVVGGIVVLIGAIGTGSLGAVAIAIALFALALLLGDALIARLPISASVALVRLPIAIAVGLGLLGMVLLGLAAATLLNSATVVSTAGILLLLILALDRARLGGELSRLSAWRPAAPSWFETVLIGLTVGLVAYALLTAFVPETGSDAIRQHLPIAREIWQTGSAAEFLPMSTSQNPIQAHLLYAAGYGIGGMTAVKLLQSLAGFTVIMGIAGLGWVVAGRMAAVIGAIVFATMPLVLWILGHVYPDTFAAMFTVAATLCILLWQRDGVLAWLIFAGALAGFGFAAKLNMALLVVVLAVAVFLVGRQPWQWRERLVAVVAFGLGSLVVVPWLIRSYQLNGFVGRLLTRVMGLITAILPGGPAPASSVASDSDSGGLASLLVDRLSFDLVMMPWLWPFHAGPSNWQVIRDGELGIALLMLLPLALLAPRNRAMAVLAITAVVSYIGWWFTLQNPRHLLPTLAIGAALAGIGVASAMALGTSRPRYGTFPPVDVSLLIKVGSTITPVQLIGNSKLATAAQIGVVSALIVVPVFFLPNESTLLPTELIIGRESASAYIDRIIPSSKILGMASTVLPADTRVGYIGQWEGAQFYTETRLWPLGTYSEGDETFLNNRLGKTPEAVLASLDRLGLDYFIWDRLATRPEDWRSTLLSTTFLRDHTRILAGDRDTYLFEVIPNGGNSWGEERLRNLLEDSTFEKVKKKRGAWTLVVDLEAKEAVDSMRAKKFLAQRVPVSSGSPYLLTATTKCDAGSGRVELRLRWFDDVGVELGAAAEVVIPGPNWNEQFLWRRAPGGAHSASVELARDSYCDFNAAALYQMS